jgi:hypothetical protein
MGPPPSINGAKVICWTPIDTRHQFTGRCRQVIGGVVQGPMAGLAICRYEGEDCFYLFGCDAAWNCVTDTWHATLDEALAQAEFEDAGASQTWQTAS